ncbi:casein kinase 2 regulatory subunit [Coemansia sp. Benny D115]|nr:casein kinase 2 regulatory subunit [Coemansia sp. Benny D115]
MAEPTYNSHNDSTLLSRDQMGSVSQDNEYHSGLDNTEESDLDEEPYGSDDSANLSWIKWFCALKGHEYFCEVPESFIEDEFNLTGLSQAVNYYVEALEMILDIEDSSNDPQYTDEIEAIGTSAEVLYGLIHARYILTRVGLDQMADKYEHGDFGVCPRYCCDGAYVVPCGRTDVSERDPVKLYCPSCNDIYTPPSSRYSKVDGAYFGTTFPHMFFQTFPSLIPEEPMPIYVPRIYGFAVNERSKAGPRMQWLRMLPDKDVMDAEDDDAGNTTDSQSYVEARDAVDTDKRIAPAHSASSKGVEPAEDASTEPLPTGTAEDVLTESMDIGTDRPGASRASTPAIASQRRTVEADSNPHDQPMPTASNSPLNEHAGSPAEDARRDCSSSESASAAATTAATAAA